MKDYNNKVTLVKIIEIDFYKFIVYVLKMPDYLHVK